MDLKGKTFFNLTIEDCYKLFDEKNWVCIYADGKFAGMRVEK